MPKVKVSLAGHFRRPIIVEHRRGAKHRYISRSSWDNPWAVTLNREETINLIKALQDTLE